MIRHRRALIFAVAVAVLLFAAACSSGDGEPPSAAADTAAEETSSPTFFAPSPTPEARQPGLYLLELSTGEVAPLEGVDPEALALAPAVSPDGSRIAFDAEIDGSRQIWVMNADGTGLERITDDSEAIDPT